MTTTIRSILSDKGACHAAFRAHDARFDGRVFVCVSSTGIYCRPVCRVKTPKSENCAFVPSAAAAEAAGYRPCLRCRPELAPGFTPLDAPAKLARRAALAIEDGRFEDGGLAGLAASLGVTDRHLRRIFAREYGVSPVQYLQTRRLLLAKSLLTDSALAATEIAFAAGFGSIRRFNDAFLKHYRMPPTALRKRSDAAAPSRRDGINLFLGYRPPYGWDKLLAFLAARAIPGVESVGDGAYRRTVALESGGKRHLGWLAVGHATKRNALAVTVAASLLPVLPTVLARVGRLFDLDCDPVEVHAALSGMNGIKPGLAVEGARLPGCFDAFEMAVRAVLGQQITVKAARTLAGRMAAAFGAPVATPFGELTHAFPSPETICGLGEPVAASLGPLGVTGSRARAIRGLALAMLRGDVTLSPSADPEEETSRLLAIPGFGPWTAQYLAMRALGWPDAFPHTDYGVRKALGDRSPKEMLKIAEEWRPWRSYATIHLWNSLQA